MRHEPAQTSTRHKLLAMRALLPLVEGIPAETLKVTQRRIPAVPKASEAAYSYTEFEDIRSRAAAVFNTALVRIRANRARLARWRSGHISRGTADWLVGEALDCLEHTGDVPVLDHGRVLPRRYRHALGGSSPETTYGRLYLTRMEANAAAVLLATSQGWNRSADALIAEPHFHVYDNPEAFLTCNYDPTKALCNPERSSNSRHSVNGSRPPALDRCTPACANIARTDAHIEQLEHECAYLDEQIASTLTPLPLRERLKQGKISLKAIADRHRDTQVLNGTAGRSDQAGADDR